MVACRIVACALVAIAGCGRFGFRDEAVDARGDGDVADMAVPPPTTVTLDVATFSTTSPTFVPLAELELPPAPDDIRWLVLTSAQLASTNFSGITVEARYLLDGVEHGIGGTEVSVATSFGPWLHADVIDASTQTQRLVYELREAQGGVAAIANLHVVAIPLPATAVHFASSDAVQSVDVLETAKLRTALSLGPLVGEHLFILVANTSDFPGEGDVYSEWYGPAGELWFDETHMPREGWQSQLFLQGGFVTNPSATIEFAAWRGAGPSQVSYVRAIALDVAELAAAELRRDPGRATTSSATPSTALQVTPATTVTSRYVALSSIRLEENCLVPQDTERVARTSIDGAVGEIRHLTDNCAYTTTYGEVRTLAGRPSSIELSYASGNTYPLEYEGAQLLLLAVP